MRHRLEEDFARAPRLLVETDACIAITLPEALDGNHEIRPYRLRTGIATPHAPRDRSHKEQHERGEHEQPRDEVELLRPDLEEEEKEAIVRHVQQHGLIGQIGAAIPAQPRQAVVDRERDGHHDPLHRSEAAVCKTRIDLLTRGIELTIDRAIHGGDIVRLDVTRRRACTRLGSRIFPPIEDRGHCALPRLRRCMGVSPAMHASQTRTRRSSTE